MEAVERESHIRSLSEQYIPKLRMYIELNFDGIQEETDDIVQSILEKAIFRMHLYDSNYSFSTWLYAGARNHCRDLLRKQRRSGMRFVPLENPEEAVS